MSDLSDDSAPADRGSSSGDSGGRPPARSWAERAEVTAVSGWILFGLGIVVAFIAVGGQDSATSKLSSLTVAVALIAGALAQLTYVGVREQRAILEEQRQVLRDIEASLAALTQRRTDHPGSPGSPG